MKDKHPTEIPEIEHPHKPEPPKAPNKLPEAEPSKENPVNPQEDK